MAIIINGRGRVGARVISGGSSGGGTDADAQAFITAASITDATQISAVNTLVTGLKSNNLWTKMKAIYPVVGGNATAHSYNLKNTSQFQLSFSSGWTHSSTGMIGNGTSAYINTNFNPSTQITSSSAWSVGFYANSSVSEGIDTGVDGTGTNNFFLSAKYNIFGTSKGRFQTLASQDYTDTNGVGFYQGIKDSSNSIIVKNGTVIMTTAYATGGTFFNANIYIGALNRNNAASFFTRRRYSLHFVSDSSFTTSEATTFYTLVQAFQTTLGRQV
jgi:hypothetical protein